MTLHFFDQRVIVTQVGGVSGKDRVHRRQNGGERVPAKRLEMRCRRLVPVAGDADRAGQPLLLRSDRGVQGAVSGRCQVKLLAFADGVQLDQVDVVGLQALE